MTLLILGLVLWSGAHWFRRIAPGWRARIGAERGKGPIALIILLSVVLMTLGVRGADFIYVYTPLPGMGWVTLGLMGVSLYFFSAPYLPGLLADRVRHNMLTGLLIWAVAHLLVNGDLVSIVLFGGLATHAIVSMALINARVEWDRPARGLLRNDLINITGVLASVVLIVIVHRWLGYDPLLGTYG